MPDFDTMMGTMRLICSLAIMVLLATARFLFSSEAVAQSTLMPARLETAGGKVERQLAQLERYEVAQQWEDYATLITQLIDEKHNGLVSIAGRRDEQLYVEVTNYCQRRLAQAATEALAAYRKLVDARAQTLYEQGLAELDEVKLQRVADEMLCSTQGSDALLALGELALGRGEYLMARAAWRQLAAGSALSRANAHDYQAEAAARLALVSIRARQWQRAEEEILQLGRLFPRAEGYWGGKDILFSQYLPQLLAEAKTWQSPLLPEDWPTLGANYQRSYWVQLPNLSDLQVEWSRDTQVDPRSPRIAPIITPRHIIYQDGQGLHAIDRGTGKVAF